MPFLGHLDQANEFEIYGWAHHDKIPRPVRVDVIVNRRLVATVLASGHRPDVGQAGFGDGHRGFCLNPVDLWRVPENTVEVFFSGSGESLRDGVRKVTARVSEAERAGMRAMSLERWLREDGGAAAVPVPPAMADAASARLRDASRVLEFGCGDADLLRQIVDRDAAFASWTGIDVSESRVVQLRDRFRGERFRFECGDCTDWRSPGAFDLILAQGFAEHVFPSVAPLVAKWRGWLAPGGAVALDFPVYDEAMTVARSRFVNEPAPHYVRTYARWEIERMFADAGLRIGSAEQAGGRFLVLAEAQ